MLSSLGRNRRIQAIYIAQLAAVSKIIEMFEQAGIVFYSREEVALLVKWAALIGLAHSNRSDSTLRSATEEQRDAFVKLTDSLIRGVRDSDGNIVTPAGWMAADPTRAESALNWIADHNDGRMELYTGIYSGLLGARLKHQFGTADLKGLGLVMEQAFLKIVHIDSRRNLSGQDIEIMVRSLAMLTSTIMDRVVKW